MEVKKSELIGKIKIFKNNIQGLKGKVKSDSEVENLLLDNLEEKDIDELLAIISKLLDFIEKLTNHPQDVPSKKQTVSETKSSSNEEEKMKIMEAKKKELIEIIKRLKNIIQELKRKGKSDIEIENILLNDLEDKEIDQLIAIINKLLDSIEKLTNNLAITPKKPDGSRTRHPIKKHSRH
jgi:small-conductance mechanosensitive channel